MYNWWEILNETVQEIQMVLSCVLTCVSVLPPYHIYERDMCDNLYYSAACCGKYKIALEGWRKAPAVVNTCEDNTGHFIVSACAVRRKLFFFASMHNLTCIHIDALQSKCFWRQAEVMMGCNFWINRSQNTHQILDFSHSTISFFFSIWTHIFLYFT